MSNGLISNGLISNLD
ncbi:hypothetical protein CBF23_012280 [Marinomonas agarivorans]|nr:hypothetical protein CBF23_012280 [Marinomonas agarivorans]